MWWKMTSETLKKWYDYFEVAAEKRYYLPKSQIEIGRALFPVQELPQGALARYSNVSHEDKEEILAVGTETDEGREMLAKAMEQHLCNCDKQVLMRTGCKCGGK